MKILFTVVLSVLSRVLYEVNIVLHISILFNLLLSAVIYILIRRHKINDREKKQAILMMEQVKLMAEETMKEKEKIGKQLIASIAELKRKEQLLHKVKDMDSKQLDKVISSEQKTAQITKNYVKLFQEIRPEFYERLARQATPNTLSNTELKYCAYISLGMNNKDMSQVLNVQYSSIVAQKYNLKKKLHLAEEDNLNEFIVKFTPPLLTLFNIYLAIGIIQVRRICLSFHFPNIARHQKIM